MRLTKLRLHDYRNYEDLQIMLKNGIHILSGKNAQGKTNVLEAILYLSTTRSHRTACDEDLIKEGKEAFFIKAEIEKTNRKEELQISVNERGKNLFMYKNPVSKVSDFIGEFNAVMFCPDDMMLFNASPRVRRRFVDMELSKLSKTYVNTLFVAQKLLKERNRYLKQEHVNKEYLDVVTMQLIEATMVVMKQRHHFLKQLLTKCAQFYKRLSNDGTQIEVIYESCVPYTEDEQMLRDRLTEKYEKSRERDLAMRVTSVGIHKEDFIFQINGREVATYASQGQKRSILLALKVGMIYMIEDIIHDYPVLLLDDVFSELDMDRRKELLHSLPNEVQIFISTTDIEEFKHLDIHQPITIWSIASGVMNQG